VVKIKNKRKLKVYLKDYDSGSISQELAAEYLGITPRWFRHIYKIYKSTGSIPAIGVNLGRPKKEVPENGKKLSSRNMKCSGKMHCIRKKRFLHDAK
jgi:hypothetical protein